ncbi:MAG: hypothetical protein AAF726_17065 [Planctomycetota bacterium]
MLALLAAVVLRTGVLDARPAGNDQVERETAVDRNRDGAELEDVGFRRSTARGSRDVRVVPQQALSPARGVRFVRSAEGLPIVALQGKGSSGTWRGLQGLRVPGHVTHVRANGHLETAVDPESRETVLPVGTLLRLQAPELPSLIKTLHPDSRFLQVLAGDPAGLLWTRAGNDQLALAVDVERRAERRRRVDVSATMRGGSELFVEWKPEPGDRVERTLELSELALGVDVAPLSLVAVGPESREDLQHEFAVGSLEQNVSETIVFEPELVVRVQSRFRGWRSTVSGPRTVIADVPSGERFVAGCRREDGWYGVTVGEHEGPVAEIALHPPLRLQARVVDEEGDARSDVRYLVRFGGQKPNEHAGIAWSTDGSVRTGADGVIDLVLPDDVPCHTPGESFPLRIPAVGRLIVDGEGLEQVVVPLELPASGTVDLGEIVLAALQDDFQVTTPLDGIGESWMEFAWVGPDGRTQRPLVEERTALPGGSALRLERGEFPTESPPAHAMLAFDEGLMPLTLDAGRTTPIYAAGATAARRTTFDLSELDPAPSRFHLGIRWREIDVLWPSEVSEDGQIHAIDVRVPANGAEWVWRERLEDRTDRTRVIGRCDSSGSHFTLQR